MEILFITLPVKLPLPTVVLPLVRAPAICWKRDGVIPSTTPAAQPKLGHSTELSPTWLEAARCPRKRWPISNHKSYQRSSQVHRGDHPARNTAGRQVPNAPAVLPAAITQLGVPLAWNLCSINLHAFSFSDQLRVHSPVLFPLSRMPDHPPGQSSRQFR